jgi:hypothetical protein
MKQLRIALLAVIVLAVALPAPANASRIKRCDGIGKTITKLRAKGYPCDSARTLSAKWVETAAAGGGPVARLDGFRCVRRNPPGPDGPCAAPSATAPCSWPSATGCPDLRARLGPRPAPGRPLHAGTAPTSRISLTISR